MLHVSGTVVFDGGGPGGGPVAPCKSGNLMSITHLPMTSGHSVMAHWKATPQLPFNTPQVTNVVINGKIPIVNNDLLALHPTKSVYQVTRTAGKCTIVAPTNAWWCHTYTCLLYTSPSPRDVEESRMPSSA